MKSDKAGTFAGKDELYRQLTDTKLSIALLEQLEEETTLMEGEAWTKANPDAAKQEECFFAENEARTIAAIHRQLRRQAVGRFVRHDLPRVGRVAAAVLLVLYLGLTTAVATVQSVRVSLMKLLYNVEEQYTEISFQVDEAASFDVPADWTGSYYMSYVPEGYTLLDMSKGVPQGQEVIYQNVNGNILIFSENAIQVESNINTEGFQVRTIQVNGSTGLLATKPEETTLVWYETDRYFALWAVEPVETAIQIAEGVVRIK